MIIEDRIILGIDPGTVVMGIGLIKTNGKAYTHLYSGVLRLNGDDTHLDRLKLIFETVLKIIDEHLPDALAIEEPFYGKNVQSMLKLGRAQGVAMAAALFRQIPVYGYSPRKVKQSITGKGAASKEQVASMVQRLLDLNDENLALDATDALSVALCHLLQQTNSGGAMNKKTTNYSGWSAFIQTNPDRKL